MKILDIKTLQNEVIFEVELDLAQWKKSQSTAFDNISKKADLPGFRKGHVPTHVIKNKVSQQEIDARALQTTERSLVDFILKSDEFEKSNAIDSIKKIDVIKLDEGKAPVLKITLDTMPTLVDYNIDMIKNIVIPEFENQPVSDAMIQHQIKMMTKNDTMVSDKENQVIANGDIAVIDFKGFIDNKPFAGGEAKAYELEIGSKSFIDNFEEQLIGMKKGESKDINVKFPVDYHSKDFAGKPAKFEVTVHGVKTVVSPIIDKNYLSKFKIDGVENEKQLINYLKDLFAQEALFKYEQDAMNIINQEIMAKAKISHYPSSLIASHKEQIKNRYQQQAQQQKKSLTEYLHDNKIDTKQFANIVEANAKSSLLLTIVYDAFISNFKLEVTSADEKQYLDKLIKYLGDEKQAKEAYEKNKNYAHSIIIKEKLMKKLIEQAKKEKNKK